MQLALLIFIGIFLGTNCLAQDWNWAERFGGVGSESLAALKYSDSGALILAGNYTSEIDFGNTSLQAVEGSDAYLAKLDTEGIVQWAVSAGSSDNDLSLDVEEDSEGNLLWLGQYWVEAFFEDDTITAGLNSKAYFLAKYSSEGDLLWVHTINGTAAKVANDLVVDAANNIFVTGYYSDSLMLGDTVLAAQAAEDAFLAQYDSEGNLLWGSTYGSTGIIRPQVIDLSPEGALILAGNLTGSITLGADNLNSVSTDFDMFIAAFTSSGEPLWGRIGTGVFDNLATSLAIDEAGHIFVGGHLTGVLLIEGLELLTPGFEDNLFLLKMDSEGNLLWGRALANDEFNDSSFSFDIALNGTQVLMIGHYVGELIIDDLSLETQSALEGYIAFFNTENGLVEKLAGIRGSMQTSSTEIEVDELGQVYVGGIYLGTAFFGNISLESAGNTDFFVARADMTFTPNRELERGQSGFDFFPNPVQERLFIATTQANFRIEVLNQLGQTLLFFENEKNLNLQGLPAGNYWLKYTDEAGVQSALIIKY